MITNTKGHSYGQAVQTICTEILLKENQIIWAMKMEWLCAGNLMEDGLIIQILERCPVCCVKRNKTDVPKVQFMFFLFCTVGFSFKLRTGKNLYNIYYHMYYSHLLSSLDLDLNEELFLADLRFPAAAAD